jgi:DNA-binding NtrC family response regulator
MLDGLGRVYLGLHHPAMRRVAEQVRLAAQSRCPVMLVGRAGTGKKTLARLIHYRGTRKEHSLAVLDCRRLPSFAITALLWGEAGAAARLPLGSVYLAEPGALPMDVQERLHRWLLGPEKGGQPRLRVLAGFRDDPFELARRGELLPELANALATLRIDLPTLVERRDDLPHLVDRMLRRLNAGPGRAIHGLSPDAWEILLAYSWSGNLRELLNVLAGARSHAIADVIDAGDLPASNAGSWRWPCNARRGTRRSPPGCSVFPRPGSFAG